MKSLHSVSGCFAFGFNLAYSWQNENKMENKNWKKKFNLEDNIAVEGAPWPQNDSRHEEWKNNQVLGVCFPKNYLYSTICISQLKLNNWVLLIGIHLDCFLVSFWLDACAINWKSQRLTNTDQYESGLNIAGSKSKHHMIFTLWLCLHLNKNVLTVLAQ